MLKQSVLFLTRTLVAAIFAITATVNSGAQTLPVELPPAPVHWKGSVDAHGTMLYGAASQRVFGVAVGALRADKQFELRFDALSAYGDTKDQTTGVRSITVRNSRFGSNFDWHPHARLSPFALFSAESNFQQRYASRVAAGVGAKLTIWRPDSVIGGFVQDASVSLAVLTEGTRALHGASLSAGAGTGTRARWSLRLRYRKRINESIRFSHLTLYQPTTNHVGQYTLESVTELAVPLRTKLQFTIAHRERLDSEAKLRGATSIRDGQLVIGIRATF